MIRTLIFLLIIITNNNFAQNSDSLKKNKFSFKSTLFSSVIPGSGQVHNNIIRSNTTKNRLWWKLPLIYGGLGTTLYLINFNNQEFNSIKNERLNRIDGNSPIYYAQYSENQLKEIQDEYRRLRDLSVISLIGIYFLQVIDANVESHLFLFDISDNLTFRVKPSYQINNYYKNSFSTQFSLNIKIKKQKENFYFF
ncbi:DUF5683 domain-containing protein [Flavobacteriales bacterium]|jgi:hypothetical protein|nr:DUF5683 domain-containing protein [Flavobacteriales bacterium]